MPSSVSSMRNFLPPSGVTQRLAPGLRLARFHAGLGLHPSFQHVQHRAIHAVNRAATPGHNNPHVLVVGTGVIGLATALRILQSLPGTQVSLVGHNIGRTATSAGAAGLWGPYKLSDTPQVLVERWAGDTYRHLLHLNHSEDAQAAGVSLVSCSWLNRYEQPDPSWSSSVEAWGHLSPAYLEVLNTRGAGIVQGWHFLTAICEGALYTQYLRQAVLREGARLLVTPATLSSLHEALTPESQAQWRVWSEPTGAAADELAVPTYQQPSTPQDSSQANTGSGGSSPESRMAAYVSRLPITNTPLGPVSAIINCTGLGARSLVGDPLVRPIRGQVMRVRAPWVKQVLIADDTYVIPNRDVVVLGGTSQVDDWNTVIDPGDQERLWARCLSLLPSLRDAERVTGWVGLRPSRACVRLEATRLSHVPAGEAAISSSSSSGSTGFNVNSGGSSGSGGVHNKAMGSSSIGSRGAEHASQAAGDIPVIHNYGHGGSGLTLAWGCAGDVVRLLQGLL